MIRSLLLIGILLALPSAWASKARLIALGQAESGSYYIDDLRNIFLNPAVINEQKELISLEWGDDARPTAATTTPRGEGGAIMNLGGGKAGLFLGRSPHVSDTLVFLNAHGDISAAIGNTGTNTLPEPMDTVELVYGGSANKLDWGAAILYGSTSSESDNPTLTDEARTVEFRGGVRKNNWEAHGRLNILDESKNQTATNNTIEYGGDPGFMAGGSFIIDAMHTVYAEGRMDTYTLDNDNTTNNKYDATETELTAGIARHKSFDNSANLYLAAEFNMMNFKAKGKNGLPNEKLEQLFLPITIGIEADALSWLKLRGSVNQRVVIGKQKDTDADTTTHHNPNSTTVAAGASIQFNKFTVDGTFAGSSSTGTLNGDNLLANVSLNYTF